MNAQEELQKQAEKLQKTSKETLDNAMESMSSLSKSMQNVVADLSDNMKQGVELNTSTIEKLMAVKSPDQAFEINSEYMKKSQEHIVSSMSQINESFLAMFKDVSDMAQKNIAVATSK